MALRQHELHLNDWTTTLRSAITSSDTVIPLTTSAGMANDGGFRLRIDDEIIYIHDQQGTADPVARRGVEGTTAAAHSSGATVEALITANGLKALRSNQPAPRVNSFNAWTCDPGMSSSTGSTATNGSLFMIRLEGHNCFMCSELAFYVTTAAVAPTYARLGIYSKTGVLKATSGDLTAVITSTGAKGALLTAEAGQDLWIDDDFYVAFLQTGSTTQGALLRSGTGTAGINFGVAQVDGYRVGTLASQTALPATVDTTALTSSSANFWFGLR
jgi:hypothetical protein